MLTVPVQPHTIPDIVRAARVIIRPITVRTGFAVVWCHIPDQRVLLEYVIALPDRRVFHQRVRERHIYTVVIVRRVHVATVHRQSPRVRVAQYVLLEQRGRCMRIRKWRVVIRV